MTLHQMAQDQTRLYDAPLQFNSWRIKRQTPVKVCLGVLKMHRVYKIDWFFLIKSVFI